MKNEKLKSILKGIWAFCSLGLETRRRLKESDCFKFYDSGFIIVTQDKRWLAKYKKVMNFIETNHRNPSRHRLEES